MMNHKERFQHLYQKYTSRTCDKVEMEEFLVYVADPVYNTCLQELLDDHLDNKEAYEILPEIDWEGMYARITGEQEIYISSVSPAVNKTKPIWPKPVLTGAVAAIFLILSGVGYYMIQSSSESKNLEESNKAQAIIIEPGSNNAVLTLGNGEHISLNQVKTGALVDEFGAQVTKTAAGILSYSEEGNPAEAVSSNTLSTPMGGTYQLQLADGTKVWLNAGSSITYPVAFTGNERRVSVTGEVYFEVAKDAAKPFYVKADGTQVRVLGTHFNVNVYPEEPVAKITLAEGKVELTRRQEKQMLVPGQQAVIAENNSINLKTVSIEEVLGWKDGYFIFQERNAGEILRQLARWYNVDLVVKGKLPATEFDMKMSRSMTLNKIIDMLRFYDINCHLEGRNLILET